jgi:hypothetical protein
MSTSAGSAKVFGPQMLIMRLHVMHINQVTGSKVNVTNDAKVKDVKLHKLPQL